MYRGVSGLKKETGAKSNPHSNSLAPAVCPNDWDTACVPQSIGGIHRIHLANCTMWLPSFFLFYLSHVQHAATGEKQRLTGLTLRGLESADRHAIPPRNGSMQGGKATRRIVSSTSL